MNEPCAEELHQFDKILSSVNIRLERLGDRRIEIHDAGEVHDDIDSPLEQLQVFHRNAAHRLIQVALDDMNLFAKDALSNLLNNGTQRRGRQNLRIEPFVTGQVFLPANLYEEMFYFRKAVKQHREQNLPDKARAAEKQDGVVAERRDCGNLSGSVQLRRFTMLVFAANGIPSPACAALHQWTFAAVRNGGSF